MTKAYVVLRFGDGRYSVVADYGDYAWGSAAYEVVGCYATRSLASEAIRVDRVLRG